MSSRDRSDRFGDARRPSRPANERPSRRVNDTPLDIDPADIDRYLAGRDRPAPRAAETPPTDQRSTAAELDRLRRSLGQTPARSAPRDTRAAPEQERPRAPSSTPRRSAARAESAPTPARPALRRELPTPAYDDEISSLPPEEQLWEDDVLPPRRRPSAGVRRPSLPRTPQIQLQRPTLPRFIVRAELTNDPVSLAMIAIAILGLALMAILVANRADVLPASFATHVSASGVLDNFAAREAIWRLPLLATMLTLMDIGIAWIVMRLDRFAGRILIGGALLMQCIAWVAVFRLLW
ncbi:MAG: hypothetical protein M3N47_03585 [Chloroflexota bacterium]|nr:hypothetical protein [Chloroflexota bacterium]